MKEKGLYDDSVVLQNSSIAAEAERRALLYRTVVVACLPPTTERLTLIADARNALLGVTPPSSALYEALGNYLDELDSALEVDNELLRAEHMRQFRGIAEGAWARPPYESVYRRLNIDDKLALLDEITAFMRAHNMVIDIADEADGLVTELDVARYLYEAASLLSDPTHLMADADAWVSTRLQPWVGCFAKEVSANTSQSYWQALTTLIERLVLE